MRAAALAATLAAAAAPAAAQDRGAPGPWVVTLDGFTGYQAPADIDGGGDVAIGRAFGSVTVSRFRDPRNQIGVTLGTGRTWYDFGGSAEAPWGDIRDARISLPTRFAVSDRATVTLVPSLRFDAEEGVDLADGQTEGVFAAVTWRLSDRLTIGPGVGAFTGLDDDANVFPILAIDWEIAPRLRLSTGQGVGASQGPGLTLSYALTDALRVGVAGRYESTQFRLDDDGPAPGGIGEDEAFPIVATFTWEPNPGISASGFAGVETGGELTVRDAGDRLVERRDVDPAPVAGLQVRVRF